MSVMEGESKWRKSKWREKVNGGRKHRGVAEEGASAVFKGCSPDSWWVEEQAHLERTLETQLNPRISSRGGPAIHN